MEHLKQMLVREMSGRKDKLLCEVRKGALDVEVTFNEDPGEIAYLAFVKDEDLLQAVKEAVKTVLGEKAEAFNIFKKGRTVSFSILYF